MLVVTITGVFREIHGGSRRPPLRFFCRSLTIVPAGTGFCIINEQLHITNATDAQTRVGFFDLSVTTEIKIVILVGR